MREAHGQIEQKSRAETALDHGCDDRAGGSAGALRRGPQPAGIAGEDRRPAPADHDLLSGSSGGRGRPGDGPRRSPVGALGAGAWQRADEFTVRGRGLQRRQRRAGSTRNLGPDGRSIRRPRRQAAHSRQVRQLAVSSGQRLGASCSTRSTFFEDAAALGRPIPWAFEGNRLIVVPHAGYGENAYYDRDSKSLQFYYCGSDDTPVYTCLSADIVHHEFGHAVLDGIRPFLQRQHSSTDRGVPRVRRDLTAILLALSHKPLRDHLAAASGGNLAKAESL